MEQNRSTTARAGLYAVGSIVSEELRWIFREQPVEDASAQNYKCAGGPEC